MPDERIKSEYMMELPMPVIVADRKTALILYANTAAENGGLIQGQNFYDSPVQSNDPSVKCARVMLGQRALLAEFKETDVRYGGKDARLIAFVTLLDEADSLRSEDLCVLFTGPDRARASAEFLRLTGQSAGAYCAALYEARTQRYVLREEWRSRRSVSIPVLRSDFLSNLEAETQQLQQTKGASDIAVFPYTKTLGTKGVAVYFFDKAPDDSHRERLSRFVSLYAALSPDIPDSSRVVLYRGVEALEQGIAVWNAASRALLYSNSAYQRIFGKENKLQLTDELGKNLRGRVTRETIADGRGRYFDVTHTVCGSRGQGIISTIIVDNTAYVKAQRRLDAMANTDALTGLSNRRAGLDYLETMYAQCRQRGTPLTVCFADIDGLKHINDTWGHGAGDAMIQSVAAVLKKYVSEPGKVCRLGGDEFVLILPEYTAGQASTLAVQISQEAGKRLVGGSDGITMSFGFKQAEFIAGETAQTLVSVADMEMYRVKSSKPR